MVKRPSTLIAGLTLHVVPVLVITLAASPLQAQVCHTILGKKFLVANPLPGAPPVGDPTKRKIKVTAVEPASPDPLTGNPLASGVEIEILTFQAGGTPVIETFSLPAGALTKPPVVGWRGNNAGTNFKYVDPKGVHGPVKKAGIARTSAGKFMIQAILNGKNGPIATVPPDPGAYGGMIFAIVGGDSYAVNFGGAAGGVFKPNTAQKFVLVKPTSESVCPTLTPTCGDGMAEPPFETCDGGDDVSCPGECGSNGFPCQCPFCGDGTVDPGFGEQCDLTDFDASVGRCNPFEGCTFRCRCTVCGDGVAQGPEECDKKDDEACSMGCVNRPGKNQSHPSMCRCKGVCGDDTVNQVNEDCDGTDDDACPGACLGNCKCP
jgi:hypothetical protein